MALKSSKVSLQMQLCTVEGLLPLPGLDPRRRLRHPGGTGVGGADVSYAVCVSRRLDGRTGSVSGAGSGTGGTDGRSPAFAFVAIGLRPVEQARVRWGRLALQE